MGAAEFCSKKHPKIEKLQIAGNKGAPFREHVRIRSSNKLFDVLKSLSFDVENHASAMGECSGSSCAVSA